MDSAARAPFAEAIEAATTAAANHVLVFMPPQGSDAPGAARVLPAQSENGKGMLISGEKERERDWKKEKKKEQGKGIGKGGGGGSRRVAGKMSEEREI